MDALLTGLRAAAEPTRFRLLVLCAHGEFTASELTEIVRQSQPRVSRHLRLLCEAGLVDRQREGARVFFRLALAGPGAELARRLVALGPAQSGAVARDLARLDAVKQRRRAAAEAYFRANVHRWSEIRALHVPEAAVEAAIVRRVTPGGADHLLDVGTGTGRMLELLAPHVRRGTGIDVSRDMLAVARANLDRDGCRHCRVRQADMYDLPLAADSVDLVTVHQVLHYADEPDRAVAEVARVLRPDGQVVIVDFSRHELEQLRARHAHRRLGFADAEIEAWCRAGGLVPVAPEKLAGGRLTVAVWAARKPVEPERSPP